MTHRGDFAQDFLRALGTHTGCGKTGITKQANARLKLALADEREVTTYQRLFRHWFQSLSETREIIQDWQLEYNRVRPHSSLDNLTPEELFEPSLDSVYAA